MFEVIFHYYKKSDDGKYMVDNPLTFKKVIGSKDEDTPLEKLASLVIGQLARRDIWISDVDCFEFVRRKISFRETKNGVVIKNAKFSFDQSMPSVILEEENEVEKPPHTQIKKQVNPSEVIRYEYYDDSINAFIPNFTRGKKYPILKEMGGLTKESIPVYLVVDNVGNRREVSSIYFSSSPASIVDVPTEISNEIKLSYPGQVYDMVPGTNNVRR